MWRNFISFIGAINTIKIKESGAINTFSKLQLAQIDSAQEIYLLHD